MIDHLPGSTGRFIQCSHASTVRNRVFASGRTGRSTACDFLFLREQNFLLSFGFLREQNNLVVTTAAFPREKNYSALPFRKGIIYIIYLYFLERTELPRITPSKRTKITGNILSMRKWIPHVAIWRRTELTRATLYKRTKLPVLLFLRQQNYLVLILLMTRTISGHSF